MAPEIPEMFDAFGPQLNTFTSVGILLQYFRRKLLQFEWSKTVSNLVMCRFMISLTNIVNGLNPGVSAARILLQDLHITPL